jgi:alpha-L-fucosidase
VKSLDYLMDLYFKSVGRNSVLLLSVPPDKRGLIADADVARLREFGAAVRGLNENSVTVDAVATAGATRNPANRFGPQGVLDGNPDTYWTTPDNVTSTWLEVDLGQGRHFDRVTINEFEPRIQRFENKGFCRRRLVP